MPDLKLSCTAALVLQTIRAGYEYGFDIMDVTALPSGTVYPTLRRLEQQDLIKSNWEAWQSAFADQRPARKYYRLSREGKDTLNKAAQRYALLDELASAGKNKRR